ncbi:MAG: TonB family protein, partial [Candidatus Eisenbacteria bacterium]
VWFLLAEHDLFTFGAPDSAFARYRLVAGRFPGSPFAPRAAAAEVYLLDRDGGAGAARDSLLRSLVRDYPKSREAVEYLDRGEIAVEPESLETWIALYEEAHPEADSASGDSAAASGEELPDGSEGEVSLASREIGPLEGPPAPLRIDKRVEAVYPLVPHDEGGPEGTAEVEVEVRADGKVVDARILRSSEKIFEGPALAAAYQCRFVPETIEGTRSTSLRFDFRPSPR